MEETGRSNIFLACCSQLGVLVCSIINKMKGGQFRDDAQVLQEFYMKYPKSDRTKTALKRKVTGVREQLSNFTNNFTDADLEMRGE